MRIRQSHREKLYVKYCDCLQEHSHRDKQNSAKQSSAEVTTTYSRRAEPRRSKAAAVTIKHRQIPQAPQERFWQNLGTLVENCDLGAPYSHSAAAWPWRCLNLPAASCFDSQPRWTAVNLLPGVLRAAPIKHLPCSSQVSAAVLWQCCPHPQQESARKLQQHERLNILGTS